MREYKIIIQGGQEMIFLSPQMIERLVKAVQKSQKRELTISARELLPPDYTDYLANVLKANAGEGTDDVSIMDIYERTADQISLLEVEKQACFDRSEILGKDETKEERFVLKTGETFFCMTRQSDRRFCYICEDGEEICFVFQIH